MSLLTGSDILPARSHSEPAMRGLVGGRRARPVTRGVQKHDRWPETGNRGAIFTGRLELVRREVEAAPAPVEGLAQLVMLVRPLSGHDDLLEPVLNDANPALRLEAIFREGKSMVPSSKGSFVTQVAHRALWRRRIGAWAATTDLDGSASPGSVKSLRIDDDGSIHLFLDRVGARAGDEGPVLLFEDEIAETVTHVCSSAAAMYAQADFEGPVVVGLGLRGLLGGESWALTKAGRGAYPLAEAAYLKEVRTSVAALRADPIAVARELATDLMEALTQRQYDPFEARRA
jgi:hypothetical protein